MPSRLASCLAAAALVVLAGCPSDPDFIECRDDTSCDRFVGGGCLVNPETGNQFCTYPDAECEAGMRWSDRDVEASISGTCVAGDVFVPDAGLEDTTAPEVTDKSPEDGDNQVTTTTAVSVTFSEAIDASTVTPTSFAIEDEDGVLVLGTVDVDGAGATFTSSSQLDPALQYQVTLSTAIQDLAGNALEQPVVWAFTTRTGGWGPPDLLEAEQNAAVNELDVAHHGGRAVAVWQMRGCQGTQCSGAYSLQASLYAQSAWSAPLTITTSSGLVTGARAALDDAGNATVVWYQSADAVTSIFASRYEGVSWSTPEIVDPKNLGNATQPSISVDATGNVFAAWAQHDGATTNIWAARHTVGGWATPIKLETTTQTAGSVNIVAGLGGIAHAIWSQNQNVYTARYSGSTWSSPELLASMQIPTGKPQLAMGSDGAVTAIWGDGAVLFAARHTGLWSEPAAIDADLGSVEAGYDVDVDTDGRVVAVWSQGDNAWQAVFTAADDWGSAFRLETGSGATNSPSVAIGSGRGMAVWPQSSGSINDLWSNEYRSAEGWSGPALVEAQSGTIVGSPRTIYDASTNTFIAVWLQAPTGYTSVYWSRFE